MTLSSGTSSGWSQETWSSGSKEGLELQAQKEMKRKRRKESNRESARRSRMRKQQHLDDLSSQVNQVKNQNHQLRVALTMATQNLVAVEAQNSVLHAQKMELEWRMCALNEILVCMNANPCTTTCTTNPTTMSATSACDIFSCNTWSQPIDLYQCF